MKNFKKDAFKPMMIDDLVRGHDPRVAMVLQGIYEELREKIEYSGSSREFLLVAETSVIFVDRFLNRFPPDVLSEAARWLKAGGDSLGEELISAMNEI